MMQAVMTTGGRQSGEAGSGSCTVVVRASIMQRTKTLLIAVACVALETACISLSESIKLVPGADQVRLTTSPADIASCKPVGNVHPPDVVLTPEEFRNEVVGLGGNAAMVTFGSVPYPISGVAYLCSGP